MNEPASQFLPGLKPVLELMELAPARIKKIFIKDDLRAAERIKSLASAAAIPVIAATAAELDRLCQGAPGKISHQGVVAVITENQGLPLASLLNTGSPLPLIIALDQVQDPGNLGTLCRTAWALGCAGLLLPEHNSALPGPAAMRSSAGSLALMPFSIVTNLGRALDQAEEAGFFIYGAGQAASVPVRNACEFAWPLPAVLVLGNENHGLRPGVAKRCSEILAIPMARNFNSLNVAQAGAILIAFCAASQKLASSNSLFG